MNEFKKIVSETIDPSIREMEISGYLLKKITESTAISIEKSGNQYHIDITDMDGPMNFFPIVTSAKYLSDKTSAEKRRYEIKIPLMVQTNNIADLLSTIVKRKMQYKLRYTEANIDDAKRILEHKSGLIPTYTIGAYNRRTIGQHQTEIGTSKDEQLFLMLRHLVLPNEYLLFVKIKNQLNYIVYGIPSMEFYPKLSEYFSMKPNYFLNDKENTLIDGNNLIDSVVNQIPEKEVLIKEDKNLREFALKVFLYFFEDRWNKIFELTSTTKGSIGSNKFISHDFEYFKRLIAEFKSPQTKRSLTSSNTQRYFEDPILVEGNKYYYFTTQWNGKGEYDLSFKNLKRYFESEFPEYRLEVKNGNYRLYKVGRWVGQNLLPKVFHEKAKEAGLIFSKKLVLRFISSLCTKPFVILTGLSGSGKTKLAQAFVQWICESENQYKIVPVGADWTNREPLLGYPNGLISKEYIFPDSGALQVLIEANKPENSQKPYFLILDEMNLSHVERYFADFLSVMESHKRIKLYDGPDRYINEVKIDKEIIWPKNLFVIGTVNVDETTYMFSPKVLDRANVIEFRVNKGEMSEFLKNVPELEMKKLHFGENEKNQGSGANMAVEFMKLADNRLGSKTVVISLNDFFPVLQKVGAEFGYRTASEITRLAGILETITDGFSKSNGNDLTDKDFIDIAIMQKLLPKLHGSRNRLVPVLAALGRLCIDSTDEKYSAEKDKDGKQFIGDFFEKEVSDDNILYKLSFDKIKRMYKNLIANGFTSYAEA